MTSQLILDDRLLIAHVLDGAIGDEALFTTSLWYYRACRAAVLGAGGKLSGPFRRLDTPRQRAAILRLLELPDDVALVDARRVVPEMARIAERHPRLNVMNLEAVAAARSIGATVALSRAAAAGVLPAVLDAEGMVWRVVDH